VVDELHARTHALGTHEGEALGLWGRQRSGQTTAAPAMSALDVFIGFLFLLLSLSFSAEIRHVALKMGRIFN
jgi:hypothetical protein